MDEKRDPRALISEAHLERHDRVFAPDAASDGLSRLRLYVPEKRPWLAHLTIARYRRPGHPFSLQNVTVGPSGLPSVILYASLLERGAAVHTPLASFPAKVLPERSAPRG